MNSSTDCETRTRLTVEIAADRPCGLLIQTVVLPFRTCLRARGRERESDSLRLEWPTTEQPRLALHLLIPRGDERAVTASFEHCARACRDIVLTARPATDGRALFEGPPLDGDAELAGSYYACLAHATTVHLDAAADAVERPLSYADRQQLALTLVLSGLQATMQEGRQRRAYLAFHRDWLLRYPVLHRGYGRKKVAQLFDLLEAQVDRVGVSGSDELMSRTSDIARRSRPVWTLSLMRLVAHLTAFPADARCHIDPFASGPLFPVLFRLFHAVARQFGVALLDEAFLHHLLLRSEGADAGRTGFCLAPPLERLPESADSFVASDVKPLVSVEEDYPWRRLIAAGGEQGPAWLESYQRSERAIGDALPKALRLLREGCLSEGASLLAHVEQHRQEVRVAHASIYHTLGRFYHGELAYWRYRLGDVSGAERELDLASSSVRRAIELHGFLLPLAPLLVDIPLQKARIARSQQDWPGVARHLDVMYEMETEARPLCVLDDGTAIDYGTIAAHLDALRASDKSLVVVPRLLRVKDRIGEFRRLTARLYLPRNLVALSSPLTE